MLACLFFQREDGIRDIGVTGVQTCALPISLGFGLEVEVGRDCARHHRVYAESVRNLGSPVFPRALFEAVLGEFGTDRESVVEGKIVDLGGRRVIRKKKECRFRWSTDNY